MPKAQKNKKKQPQRSLDVHGQSVRCGACGEPFMVFVDPSGGDSQSYVEDCQVCCRPSRVDVLIDPDSGDVTVTASYEG